ncbi:MAG: hypothetical protein V2B18_16415 [Pseudomonadota bacterium]
MTVNKAYKMIRDVELGTEAEQSNNEPSPEKIKARKLLLTEGNLADLYAMGTDLGALVNMAVAHFVRWSREPGRAPNSSWRRKSRQESRPSLRYNPLTPPPSVAVPAGKSREGQALFHRCGR